MKTLLSIFLLLISTVLIGQDCNYYFNFKAGTTLTYELFNNKDKMDGTIDYTITSIENSGSAVVASIHTTNYDKKGEEITSADFEFKCDGEKLLIDIKSIVSPETMEAYKDMDVKLEGDYMSYPKNLHVGDELEDGELNIEVSSNGFPIIKMSMKTHDRKVESKENLTVPAGTYEAYKITATTTTTTIFDLKTSSAEWFSKDVGMVRSESYNKNGKLVSYMVLSSVK